jgi:uncharacterized protein YdiU (UPF0061 family)
MSIVGVTIDYGPYGFMDRYDSGFICNGSGKISRKIKYLSFIFVDSDDSGRYAYNQQPSICKWNCGKLAEAIAPLLPLQKSKPILNKFDEEYERAYMTKMRQKVKFFSFFSKRNDSLSHLVWSYSKTTRNG